MRVITQVSKLRDFEKAGGVEGLLVSLTRTGGKVSLAHSFPVVACQVSTRPENLSYFGKKMRSALFGELHRMKDRTKKKRREEVRAEGEEARKITAQNAPRIPADRVEPQKLLT